MGRVSPVAALLLAALAMVAMVKEVSANYVDPGNEDIELAESDYGEMPFNQLLQNNAAVKRSSLIYVFRRACVRRGGNCDHRPGDCCHSSSCRCNLWGANCRCQRMGLFQKWG